MASPLPVYNREAQMLDCRKYVVFYNGIFHHYVLCNHLFAKQCAIRIANYSWQCDDAQTVFSETCPKHL